MDAKEVGFRIKYFRLKYTNLSQEQFAKKVDLDRTYISKLESGKKNLTLETLNKLCDGFGITLKDFFDQDIKQEKIRLATVFSGIGAIESALNYLKLEHELVFACDNGERELNISYDELDKLVENMTFFEKQEFIKKMYDATGKPNYVKESYFSNYKITEKQWFEDIKYLEGTRYRNKVDLFVGGSPCQSFSVNGKRAGLEDIRGTLFYEYARLVDEINPKVFIYENVRGMLNHDKGKTWDIIKSIFNQLNYNIYINETPVLNSKDYGIPQNRERIFVVGIREDLDNGNFTFPKKQKLTTTVKDYFESYIPAKYYLSKKGFEFVTTHPSRARVGTEIMGCQKANQQFNWNGDFIFEPLESIKYRRDILETAYVGKWNNQEGVCRKYTPRECLRLMGFKDDFVIVHKDEIMYRQAGNSIVVNVLMKLVESIQKTGVWSSND